ncbi:MAG TPA: GDSL-type esterase/lipase family protein [Blastocatellia bacterium]|nr:GDSL-type esterase/lipase family protein [Blastocatellia bacterium]
MRLMLGDTGRKPAMQFRVAILVVLCFACQLAATVFPSDAQPDMWQDTDDFISPQPIEDPDGSAMRMFYAALMRTDRAEESAITRIIHYGDSHVAADILTGELSRKLKRGFGDSGPGYIFPVRPWSWYSRKDVESYESPGWSIEGLERRTSAMGKLLGMAGLSFTANQRGERIRIRAFCKRFDLYLMKQPGGATVEISLDGEPYHSRVSLSADNIEPGYLAVTAESEGAHSLELRTLSPGPARIFGVVAESDSPGVVYDVFGLNGARASRPLEWDRNFLEDNLNRRRPDLIIILYGSNEVGDADLDLTSYERDFSTLLATLRNAAPAASLLVISPPDRAVLTSAGWRTISRLPGLVVAQRRAALAQGAAFWDLFKAMGSGGSINRWAVRSPPLAQSDRVHLTAQGYRTLAQVLYRELMRGYVWALIASSKRKDERARLRDGG